MTVREFKEYIESKAHISKAVFWTENHEGYSVANPCKIRMAFHDISVCENSNVVCLHDRSNTITFDRVNEIHLDRKSSVLGDIVTVICGDGEYRYTLVIER